MLIDSARKLLQQLYEGLFRVFSLCGMTLKLDRLGPVYSVSTSSLKAACADDNFLPHRLRFGVNPERLLDSRARGDLCLLRL